MDDRISITIEGGVADVRMIRTDKMNALDNGMFEALIAAGERLKSEPGVRAVTEVSAPFMKRWLRFA